jgi:hypothetical protein
MNLERCLCQAASRLSDEQLEREIVCARRAALLATRTRRDAALLRIRCLRLEVERRALAAATVIARPRSRAAVG